MARRIRRPRVSDRPKPWVGMRLWLGAVFALVGALTAVTVYQFVRNSNEAVLTERSTEIAVGRTIDLADQVGDAVKPDEVVDAGADAAYTAWYFDRRGRLIAPRPPGPELEMVTSRRRAVNMALIGGRYTSDFPGGVTVVAFPVSDDDKIIGALLGRYSRPGVLQSAIDRLRNDSLQALVVGVCIAILIGFLVALIDHLPDPPPGAQRREHGRGPPRRPPAGRGPRRDRRPGPGAGHRCAARCSDSFQVLSSERDRLAAIFDGLTDAVMVVDNDGSVRFSNRAAAEIVRRRRAAAADGPAAAKAAEEGRAEAPALRVGDRVFALQAREVPAEQGVLVVVRDRTEEMRRELAEREFVSNAAHELRNPLAGISGAIEVLQAGAKDDPEALEHFLAPARRGRRADEPPDAVAAHPGPRRGAAASARVGGGRRRPRRPRTRSRRVRRRRRSR